jgi:O-acetyl-ADP-ribose deacetylase
VYTTGQRGEAELLASAYRNSLLRASEAGLKSVAFPAISTGISRYPLEAAADVSLRTVMEHLREHPGIELVRFVLWEKLALEVFEAALRRLVGEEGVEA